MKTPTIQTIDHDTFKTPQQRRNYSAGVWSPSDRDTKVFERKDNFPMTFIPTSQCPSFATGQYMDPSKLPLPLMSNEEIDVILQAMVDAGNKINLIPRSQYGRRVAVRMFLAGPNVTP